MNTKPLKNIYLFLATLILALPAGQALAGPGKSKDKGHRNMSNVESRINRHDDDSVLIAFGDRDRYIIRDYLQNHYAPNCPPGLAKKHNGCLPPGQAKKYRIGAPLPPWLPRYPIDNDLRNLLGPAPNGYDYVRVDKDVLLIGEATKKVIDAVTLISAVDG